MTTVLPAFAASRAVLDVRFYNTAGCPATNGIGDVYMYVNVQNNTTSPYTLTQPLVFTVTSTNASRNHVAPSTSFGTITCTTSETPTACDSFTWTIPTGTTIQAGGQVDMSIHFLSHLDHPTQLTTSTTSTSVVRNASSGTATQGYTGAGGCVSFGPF